MEANTVGASFASPETVVQSRMTNSSLPFNMQLLGEQASASLAWRRYLNSGRFQMTRPADDSEFARIKSSESVDCSEALKRLHDDIDNVRRGDNTVAGEMNKFTVVCEPPPITPRCHAEEQPPNPYVVAVGLSNMQDASTAVQNEVERLKADKILENKSFQDHFDTFSGQAKDLNIEITKLTELSKDTIGSAFDYHLDRDAVLVETKKIDDLGKAMEKTRKEMEKDAKTTRQ